MGLPVGSWRRSHLLLEPTIEIGNIAKSAPDTDTGNGQVGRDQEAGCSGDAQPTDHVGKVDPCGLLKEPRESRWAHRDNLCSLVQADLTRNM